MLEGDTLTWFMDRVRVLAEADAYPYRLRIAVDDGQFKVKFNEGTWTPPVGPAAVGDEAR